MAAQESRDLILDGEVVAYDGDQTSVTRLQQGLGATRPSPEQVAKYPVIYCVFDLLEVDGDDLTNRPLFERRARLTKTIRSSSALQTPRPGRTTHRTVCGGCQSGWDGLSPSAPTHHLRWSSKDWLKLKCIWEQEFVIGGYTDPGGSRTDFGALLVGYYEQGSLRSAGKVGTGYTKATLHELGIRLRRLETAEPSFVDVRPIPAARTGRGRSSSPRSDLQNGRATLGYGSRAFSGSATTRAPATSFESGPSEHGRRRAISWRQHRGASG